MNDVQRHLCKSSAPAHDQPLPLIIKVLAPPRAMKARVGVGHSGVGRRPLPSYRAENDPDMSLKLFPNSKQRMRPPPANCAALYCWKLGIIVARLTHSVVGIRLFPTGIRTLDVRSSSLTHCLGRIFYEHQDHYDNGAGDSVRVCGLAPKRVGSGS